MNLSKGRSDPQKDTGMARERGKLSTRRREGGGVMGQCPRGSLRKKDSWFLWKQNFLEKKPFE